VNEPIQNVVAEKQILGSLMQQPALAERVFAIASPNDFNVPAHAHLAAVLHRRFLAGEPMHASAVLTAVTADGALGKIGGGPYLFELVQQVEVPASASLLAEDVRRCSTRRGLVEIGTRIAQRARSEECEPLAVTSEAQVQLADVTEAELITGNITVPTLADFLSAEDDAEDWVIPGLLAREDRMILTGAEGLGKMMLLRQIAVTAAAGIHPFTHQPMRPRTVLLVDLENPAQIMRQTIRKMVEQAKIKSSRHDVADRVYVERRPEGLNLAEPANVAWLMKRVTLCDPDILIIGPLYKLMNDNPNDEATARACTVALDLVRTRGRCALLLEAHAGHATSGMTDRPVRPTGSSLWLRWPEFGYGLRRAKTDDAHEFRRVEFVAWRGARGERDWPSELIADPRFAFQIPTFDGRAA
jgi:hypothetical protein